MIPTWMMVALLAAPGGGDSLWSRHVSPEAGPRALAVAGDTLLVTTWDNAVLGLDASTGRERWRVKSARPDHFEGTQMARVDDVVGVLFAEATAVVGHDAHTGTPRWTLPLESPGTSLVGCVEHALMVVTARGTAADGTRGFLALGVGPDGAVRWRAPVEGDLVGAGDGYVFAEQRSGVGRLKKNLQAIRCSDGAVTTLEPGPARHLDFLQAAEGKVVTAHFEMGGGAGPICVTDIASGDRTCVEPSTVAPAGYRTAGALLRASTLYFAVAHLEAHNLNPAPDSWIFAWDLSRGRLLAQSPPLIASLGPVDAGAQIVAAFGTTGAADHLTVLDPTMLKPLLQVATRKAPTALAVDATRAFVGSYDGAVTAVRLPLPGTAPAKQQPVAQVAEVAAPAVVVPDLGWTIERVIDAHPKRGRTSGSDTDGTVGALAFVGSDALATGGNDDRVRVFGLEDGKSRFVSKPLGKDVDGLEGCADGTLVARVYGGAMSVFRARGTGWRATGKIRSRGGWMFGVSPDCRTVVADEYGGTFHLFDVARGAERGSFQGQGQADHRGLRVRGGVLLVQRGEALERHDLTTDRPGEALKGSIEAPSRVDDGGLVQAWVAGDAVLREYCGPTACTVYVGERALRFDTRGAAWSPSVPSMVDLSPDGRFMVWTRDGLDLVLVDVQSDARQPLGNLRRTMSATPKAAFSPDGRRLAVAMQPEPWQVTIYRAP